MDRLTKLASNLYPRWWRDRYGDEFAALIEDARPGLGGTWDVLRGALAMQFTTFSAKRILLVGAAAGLLVGFAAAFAFTPQYASHAVVRVSPGEDNRAIADSINQLSQEVLKRAALVEMIDRMDLYRNERSTTPMEDIIENFRKNIRITAVPVFEKRGRVTAFDLAFIYPDSKVAQLAVDNLIHRFLDENIRARRGALRHGMTLEVLDPANLPAEAIVPNHRNIAVVGLVSGLFLSGLLALALHFRRKRQPA